MSRQFTRDFALEVAKGKISGHSFINKFGRNTAVGTTLEDIWDVGGTYAFPNTGGEAVNITTSGTDSGTVIGSATASGGTTTTATRSVGDWTSDGVAVGDIFVNDTTNEYSAITTVAAQTLTFEAVSTATSDGDSVRVIDKSGSGVGAHAVHIQGLDANFDLQEDIVVFTGASVAAGGTWERIFRMKIISAGTAVLPIVTTSNVNAVSAVTATSTRTIAQISATQNQTLMAIYTIPNGKTGYLRRLYATISAGNTGIDADVILYARDYLQVFRNQHDVGVMMAGTSAWQKEFFAPNVYKQKTDLIMRTKRSAAGSDIEVHAGFDIILVDN
jgi:hypothetical protein